MYYLIDCHVCKTQYDGLRNENCPNCNVHSTENGIKYDNSKTKWELLDLSLLEDAIHVLSIGANKYAKDNWKKLDVDRIYSALMRHIVSWRSGDRIDSESDRSHLSHALCNILFLIWKEKNNQIDA